ncbi:unnamed protein product [Closterium sp. NIES-53]
MLVQATITHTTPPGAKKSDVLREFAHWLVVVERQAKKSVMVLHSDRGGEFLEKQFTDFVDSKGIVHDLTCPYTPRQNGMVETEMRTVVESVQTMLLHLGVQHHWWHLTLRQAVWVRNCLERSTLPPGTTPYKLLTGRSPTCCWHGVPEESKGWEILDITDNQVVTTSDVVFYETMSLEVWASEHGSTSGRTQVNPPTDTSIAMLPLGKLADEDAGVVRPPSPSTCPPRPTPCSRPASADIAGRAAGREGAAEFGGASEGGISTEAADRGAANSVADQGAVGGRAVGREADNRDADYGAAGRRGQRSR